jgi:hypothetical protein
MMKRTFPALLAIFLLCTVVCAANCQAVVAVSDTIKTNASLRHMKSAKSESTGSFGGIKNGNRFLLILSPGAVMYFGINDSTKARMGGLAIKVNQIPQNANIRVISERGIILEVDVMEDKK